MEKRGANWREKWGQERVFMVACLYVKAGGKEKKNTTGDAGEKRGNRWSQSLSPDSVHNQRRWS